MIRCCKLLQLVFVDEPSVVYLYRRDAAFSTKAFHRLPMDAQNGGGFHHVEIIVKDRHIPFFLVG